MTRAGTGQPAVGDPIVIAGAKYRVTERRPPAAGPLELRLKQHPARRPRWALVVSDPLVFAWDERAGVWRLDALEQFWALVDLDIEAKRIKVHEGNEMRHVKDDLTACTAKRPDPLCPCGEFAITWL